MKKLAILFSLFAFLVGCEQHDELDQIGPNNPNGDGSTLPETLYASIEDKQSRAFVDEDNVSVLWHNGDAVSFFEGTSQNVKYVNSSEAGATATFELVEGTGSEAESSFPYAHAIYPYSTDYTSSTHYGNVTIQTVSVNYPATQTYAEGSFGRGANLMFGRVESEEDPTKYYFRHVNGFLVLKLYGEGVKVKEIKLTALGDVKIAGAAEINSFASASAISANMKETATSTVTLNCSNGGAGVALGATAETATEFWFALPEVKMTSGMKIEVTSTDGILFEKQTTKSVNIGRAKVQPMAALKFEANSPYQLLYTTSDGNILDFEDLGLDPFNVEIASHTYENGQGIINFKAPLTEIKDGGFDGGTDVTLLQTITLPETVTRIGVDAFMRTRLIEITIPGSVNEIGEGALMSNFYLKSITFLPSPTNTPLEIAYYTNGFRSDGPLQMSPLTSINLNRQLNYVDDEGNPFTATSATYGIFNYEDVGSKRNELTVTLGEQVTSIPAYMFAETPITEITIPANVTKINEYAFYDCEKLANLTFESGANDLVIVESGDGPFYDSPLTSINLDRELVYQDAEGNAFVADSWSEGIFVNSYYDDVADVSLTLGPNVETIHDHMFNYLQIHSLNLPADLYTIGKAAFRDTPITSLTIPAGVITIGVDAFYNCENLTSVNFEGNDTYSEVPLYIGYSTYGTNERGPFYYSPLTSVTVDRNLSYHMGLDDYGNPITFAPDRDDEGMFSTKNNGVTSVTIGDHVRILGEYTFSYLPITSVTIPGNVRTIKNNVFNGCEEITSVTFEAGTSTLNLGYDTEFDDSDYGVGRGPFLNSPNINTVVLNRNINYSFGGEVDADTYNSVIRASIFNNNHKLTNITIDEGVTSLPDYAFAGAGLSGKDIRLHEGLQTIGKYAFYDAQINGGIYIPASVTTIKDRAFRMNNDSKITCLGTTPPTIVEYPFYTNILYKIYVPAGSVDAYKAAWPINYTAQIQAITE